MLGIEDKAAFSNPRVVRKGRYLAQNPNSLYMGKDSKIMFKGNRADFRSPPNHNAYKPVVVGAKSKLVASK